jgi:hypothetical protein
MGLAELVYFISQSILTICAGRSHNIEMEEKHLIRPESDYHICIKYKKSWTEYSVTSFRHEITRAPVRSHYQKGNM